VSSQEGGAKAKRRKKDASLKGEKGISQEVVRKGEKQPGKGGGVLSTWHKKRNR